MDTHAEHDTCRVNFTESGIDVEGPCAEQFMDMFVKLSSHSRSLGLEVSGYACINPATGRVERAGVYTVGTARESTLPPTRTCPCQQPQVTFHTHPTSGLARFSDRDAVTVANRMNTRVDEGHCVVGDREVMCIFTSHMDFPRGN
jgi:hypothetical protein